MRHNAPRYYVYAPKGAFFTFQEDTVSDGMTEALRATGDAVNHPSHYTSHPSGVECIMITEGFNFNIGNVIKYAWRAGLKNPDPLEDLKKAQWYLNREIERVRRTR